MAPPDTLSGSSKPGLRLDTLPPEILNQIFGDLLKITDDHCHRAGITDVEPTSTENRPQRIETSILLANRSIGKAGRRYLYIDNRLVIVSYNVSSLSDSIRPNIRRYITKGHLQNFKHHILDFSFRIDSPPGPHERYYAGMFMFRECDLRPFLSRLQGLAHVTHSGHIYLLPAPSLSSGTSPLRYKLRVPGIRWSTHIIVRETPLSRHDMSQNDKSASEIRLLRHFDALAGVLKKAKVSGVQAESLRLAAFADLSARIVSVEAMGWSFLQTLLKWETSCAELFNHSPPPALLLESYSLLFSLTLHNHLTFERPGLPSTAPQPVVDADVIHTWQFGVRVLELDICISSIGLKMHEIERGLIPIQTIEVLLEHCMSAATSAMKDFFPPQLLARALHLLAVMAGHVDAENRDSVQIHTLAMAVELTPGDQMLRTDLRKVVDHMDGKVCIDIHSGNTFC